ncbi:hypothetical protein NIES4075_70090 [Tolypothrix sp. NIES-4075]|uniref:hypothetical protein n=1 Tax=Tolypothrix sp. NIES-4075 TaxID=2005459 RepID=UPI000B5C7515|nr:hypothetical protein [Tolypothrix sp. NIES-4075]GAX45988.1 hypothetical protein NIES4075_70090 [Tolypothrix sp. NIES-4075]
MSKLSVFNFLQYLDADDNLQQEVKYLTEIDPNGISKIVELARSKTDINLGSNYSINENSLIEVLTNLLDEKKKAEEFLSETIGVQKIYVIRRIDETGFQYNEIINCLKYFAEPFLNNIYNQKAKGLV